MNSFVPKVTIIGFALRLSSLLLVSLTFIYPVIAQNQQPVFRPVLDLGKYTELRSYHLLEDARGYLWINSEYGLLRFNGYESVMFSRDPSDVNRSALINPTGLIEDQQGNIWFTSITNGVGRYAPRTELFHHYGAGTENEIRISSNHVSEIVEDNLGRVWVLTANGFERYNIEQDRFELIHFHEKKDPITSSVVRGMTMGPSGNLWLSIPDIGLVQVDLLNERILDTLGTNLATGKGLPSLQLYSSPQIDANGGIYLSIRDYGIIKIDPVSERFQNFPFPRAEGPDLNLNKIKLDEKNNLWNFGGNNGAWYLNTKTGEYQHADYTTSNSDASHETTVYTVSLTKGGHIFLNNGRTYVNSPKASDYTFYPVARDNDYSKQLWVNNIKESADGSLLVATHYGGLYRIDLRTNTVLPFSTINRTFLSKGKFPLIRSVYEDALGRIWIATRFLGLLCYNPSDDQIKVLVKPRDPKTGAYRSFSTIEPDNKGNIWVGAEGSKLFKFDLVTLSRELYDISVLIKDSTFPYDITSLLWLDSTNVLVAYIYGGLKQVTFNSDNDQGLSIRQIRDIISPPVDVKSLYRTAGRNVVWASTNQGLYRVDLGDYNLTHFDSPEGLPNNVVNNTLIDSSGRFWLSSHLELISADSSLQNIRSYATSSEYSNLDGLVASIKLSDGRLALGGRRGVTILEPDKIEIDSIVSAVQITQFTVYEEGEKNHTIPGIDYQDQIKLSHSQKDFMVEFTAVNPIGDQEFRYGYRLEGYHNDWVELGDRRHVTINNMNAGTYQLRVRAANADGIWRERTTPLEIKILAPWWAKWWTYIFYGLLFSGLLYSIYRYRMFQTDANRLRELNAFKSSMYTRITHEFRTPLTVILGLNQQLRSRFVGKGETEFAMIERSSQQLLGLINQLLELNRAESGKVAIKMVRGNLVHYLGYLAESFQRYAMTADIQLHFLSDEPELILDYDPDKLLTIVSNLLSNAIKYSPPMSSVYLQLDVEGDHYRIRVSDRGYGIPSDNLLYVFDHFYNVPQPNERQIDGVGIGLTLTRELVQLLGGEITVKSTEGEGSVFTVTLPITNQATWAEEVSPEKQDITPPLYRVPTVEENTKTVTKPTEKASLLIIEDNPDVVHYLRQCLGDNWQIYTAIDGGSGVEQALEHSPDVILSDIMMPVLDGYTVLDRLKADDRTSHIPVVLLTGRASEESRVKGFRRGADAYLLKPFSQEELLVRLDNILRQRRVLQKRYLQGAINASTGDDSQVKEYAFIHKFEEHVRANLTRHPYTTEVLSRDLGMSRTQLHHKVKTLTGKSTSIYVRVIRLREAKKLLLDPELQIAEVAYSVGFSDPNYFSRCFMAEFGESPSEFRQNQL